MDNEVVSEIYQCIGGYDAIILAFDWALDSNAKAFVADLVKPSFTYL